MKTVLVKIGGKAAEKEERLRELCAEMTGLKTRFRFLIVHGGGAEVTAVSRRFGIESVFKDGVRKTSAAEMDIVDMVLSGKINSRLVRLCRACGLDAVGIRGSDGGTFLGTPGAESRTAEMGAVDRRLLDLLLEAGFLPVISPTSMDAHGRGLNINADSVAFGLAGALASSALVFLSDIPGILRDGRTIAELTRDRAKDLVKEGIVTGGMIPKLTASLEAISKGVESVIIGEYAQAGALTGLLEERMGTRIRG